MWRHHSMVSAAIIISLIVAMAPKDIDAFHVVRPLSSSIATTTIRRTSSITQSSSLIHYSRRINSKSTLLLLSQSNENNSNSANTSTEGDDDDDEWHPIDNASTTPQLLCSIWNMIAQGSSMVRGDTMTVQFPKMADRFTPSYLNRLLGHLDTCKDVCDNFGISTMLIPYVNKETNKVVGFTVKSYRNPNKNEDEYEFDYDPFWDDGMADFDYAGVDDEYDDFVDPERNLADLPEITNKIPDDDDEIIDISKKWVDKMMSDMGICPFTSSAESSGMPMGPVFYAVDRSTKFEDVYARYWKEVVRIEQNPEKELSTSLLITPEFCMDHVELYENFATSLQQPLEVLGIENLIQIIFFHPDWVFRDGSERSGQSSAANYARRSPWPMINIIRTPQVRKAQKGIPTGLVYQQNEKTLNSIGTNKLELMLRTRNWDDISDVKVNRREMEALRIAQDLKNTGEVAEKDRDIVHDSTPAANKGLDKDSDDTQKSNFVNVLKEALGKRLGIDDENNNKGRKLSGPETSSTIMASDFLLSTLNEIKKEASAGGSSSDTTTATTSTTSSTSTTTKKEEATTKSSAKVSSSSTAPATSSTASSTSTSSNPIKDNEGANDFGETNAYLQSNNSIQDFLTKDKAGDTTMGGAKKEIEKRNFQVQQQDPLPQGFVDRNERAKQMLLEDFDYLNPNKSKGNQLDAEYEAQRRANEKDETNVMFGGKGILQNKDDDDDNSNGGLNFKDMF